MITAWQAGAQEAYCRYEFNHEIHYGRLEENKIFAMDRAPWDGGTVISENGIDPAKVRLLHPSEPKLILGLGKSYQENWNGIEPYKTVRWFLKPPASAASPGDDVVIPSAVDSLKVEVELVIVIGKKIKEGNEAEAEKAIFGYTIGNDIVGYTASYYEKEGRIPKEDDPLLGPGLKIGDGFAPFGPFIYTSFDWRNKDRTLVVKDRQNKTRLQYRNSMAGLLYSPAKIVSDLSRILTLSPGDVIFSGTSKSFVVSEGETVQLSIQGLGELENKIILNRP